MCYSKFAREREDEDTLDLIAAPWEAIPDEEEVQEMLADSSGDWQDEERTLRVLCYWPSYLKHYGYAVEGCTDYNTVFTLDEVELWKVDKYCYVGMPFMSFALNFNSGYSCTPFTNFRVHGSVWTNDETICCTDCLRRRKGEWTVLVDDIVVVDIYKIYIKRSVRAIRPRSYVAWGNMVGQRARSFFLYIFYLREKDVGELGVSCLSCLG